MPFQIIMFPEDTLYIRFDDLYDSDAETVRLQLEKNLDLYIDKEFKFPIQIRITNATKKLKVKTSSLRKDFDFNFKMSVDNDLINVKIWFIFKVRDMIKIQ